MAKLARVVATIEQRLDQIDQKINFLLGAKGKAAFDIKKEMKVPPSREELKASKPAEGSGPVEEAIASKESVEE